MNESFGIVLGIRNNWNFSICEYSSFFENVTF
jgi:hypothetical protein